ncbi:hypothetical protein PQR75_44935 [Paraburkholderia fungorum]
MSPVSGPIGSGDATANACGVSEPVACGHCDSPPTQFDVSVVVPTALSG